MYKIQYEAVIHENLETPSYHLNRYLIRPDKLDLDHLKLAREEILLGLVMMDLYTCEKGQEEREARSLCSTLHSTIINSKDQRVKRKVLKTQFLEAVNGGWKASKTVRRTQTDREEKVGYFRFLDQGV